MNEFMIKRDHSVFAYNVYWNNITLLCWCVSISLSETNANILPRLYQVKYDSGTLEELLYIDMPHEYPKPSGQIVLLYEKAIQECVFEQLRIVRDGQLRIVFSPDLMVSLVFGKALCARHIKFGCQFWS